MQPTAVGYVEHFSHTTYVPNGNALKLPREAECITAADTNQRIE